jgi:long-subunit acyl-CoA synthetase (AMP-forming)
VEAPSICAAFQATAAAHADQPALRAFRDARSLSWGEYADRVEGIARGLWGLGVRPGDTVALLLDNRPEFNLVDTAVLHLGAVPFSLGHPAPAEQTAYLIANAKPSLLISEHALRDAAGRFDPVVLVEALDTLPSATDFDFEATWRAVGPEDIATIVYTSGTTGVPKGVELAHRVILSSLRGVAELAPATPGDRTIAFLPTAHIAERFWSHYNAIASGLEIVTPSDPRLIDEALLEERPQRFFAVPRIYEKLAAVGLPWATCGG